MRAARDLLAARRLVLDIVGDGPISGELEDLATELGVDHAVTFHGWLPHQEVQSVLLRSNILTFPSIREFGGGVVLEAMALGVVPVVCNYAGPSELVSEESGYLIEMGSKVEIQDRLSSCLTEIVNDPSALIAKSQKCRKDVAEKYTWARKAEQIADIYEWVLSDRKSPIPRPFG